MSPTNPKETSTTLQKQALRKIRDLRSKIEILERTQSEPIAIIGMGCRFPGGVDTSASYWELLRNGIDAIGDIPLDRWDIERYYDPDPSVPGKMYVRQGGFLDQVDLFDPDFFGLSTREASSMDPQQRLLLEVSWQALEDAGIKPKALAGSQTGVFIGVSTNDYARHHLNSNNPDKIDIYSFTGTADSITSGRLSFILGLHGPNIAIDTACSSSLVGTHLACQSLRSGESNLALVGGVNVMVSPENTIYFCKVNALSPDARCKTFDSSANGYVRSEGCGIVVLKRLSDALADGDRILSVIRGSAVNQDGSSFGLTAPNGTAQRTLIQQALANAKLAPAEIDYVEAHGTGTPLGDPIEVRALGEVLAPRKRGEEGRSFAKPLRIGSVKTNLGHLEAAAGVAGLIKVVLSLQHAAIPAHLHFESPNPEIPWDDLPIKVPTVLEEWPPSGQPRRAGVSAFGFSGTNAHVILEEAPPHQAKRQALPPTTWKRKRCWVAAPLLRGGETAGQGLSPPLALPHLSCPAGAPPRRRGLHPLLGRRLYSPLIEDVCFEAQISVSRTPWIGDHQVQGQIVMPATGYVDIALTAARSVFKTSQIILQDVFYQEPFALAKKESKTLQCLIRNTESSTPSFEIVSLDEKQQGTEHELVWRTHASGIIQLNPANATRADNSASDASQLEDIRSRCQQEESAEELYTWLNHRGYYFGPAHQGISKIWRGSDTIVGEIELPEQLLADAAAEDYTFHPALLDACCQVLLPLLPELPPDQIFITIGKDEVHFYKAPCLHGEPTSRLWVHAKLSNDVTASRNASKTIKGDIAIYTPQGEKVAEVLGYLMKRTSRRRLGGAEADLRTWLYEIEWQEQPTASSPTCTLARQLASEPATKGIWLILAEQTTGAAESLYKELSWQGNLCLKVWPGEQFECIGHLTYTVNPLHPEDFESLLQEVQKLAEGFGLSLQGAIHLWSLENTDSNQVPSDKMMLEELNHCQALGVGTTLHLVQALSKLYPKGTLSLTPSFRLLLVTKGAQATSNDSPSPKVGRGVRGEGRPAYSSLWGLARVIELEHPDYHTRVVDLAPASDEQDDASRSSVRAALLRELYAQDSENLVALRQGKRLVPRLVPIKEKGEPDNNGMSLQLTIPQKGSLDHLTWQSVPRQKPAFDEVEIRVRATALNFVDVLDALGMVPFEKGGFGLDCAGEIVAIGEGVTRFKVGEPVIALAPGCFGQYVTVKAVFVAPKPTRLTFEEAATIPVVFLTAYYALYEQAKIKAGERVLIHAAAGGVGQAAIQLSHQAGAEVMGTASTGKWEFLKSQGVKHVMNSRTLHFAEEVMSITNGQGVNIALNSLRGEFIPQSISVLAANGRFVEIGEIDIWSPTQVREFRPDVSYSMVNILELCRENPRLIQAMLNQIVQQFEQGTLNPLPRQEFSSHDVIRAFRYMQQAKHIGKIVIRQEMEEATSHTSSLSTSFGLAQRSPGSVEAIIWQATTRPQLAANEVELRVRTIGLNFRDLLIALDMYAGDNQNFGTECVGEVLRVGHNVQNIRVGDNVVALDCGGVFQDYVTVDQNLAIVMPRHASVARPLSFSEAATIPTAFLTAYFALIHLAKISKGERVLIHGASGGVGLAAIQLAQQAGAEIYATSHPRKWEYLKSIGIQHVMNSRTLDFADEIMTLTHGEGVDVVLNPLTDDYITKGLEILASGGRFVDIGRDSTGSFVQTRVLESDAPAGQPERTYFSFDLLMEATHHSDLIQAIFQAIRTDFQDGRLKPLPITTYPRQEVKGAFRLMQQSKHIGKIVIQLDSAPEEVRQEEAAGPSALSSPKHALTKEGSTLAQRQLSQATVLITGGLGGLGLEVAQWLTEKGVAALALLSRSEPTARAQEIIQAISDKGTTVRLFQADVTQTDTMASVVNTIQSEMPPLRGVIHAAGVMDDGFLAHLDWSRMNSVLAPKVQGAWNLHTLTEEIPLDFFVLFSSITALFGAVGVGNYASANAFLDGLAHYRLARGLPALSINWGSWAEVGMLTALSKQAQKQWTAQGISAMSPKEAIAVLEYLMEQPRAQYGAFVVDWSTWVKHHPGQHIPPLVSKLVKSFDAANSSPLAHPIATRAESGSATGDKRSRTIETPKRQAAFLQQIKGVPASKHRTLLVDHVRREVSTVLGDEPSQAFDITQGFFEIGFDSLMSVELRNRLQSSLGCALPSTLAFDYPTIEALVDYLTQQVLEPPSAPSQGMISGRGEGRGQTNTNGTEGSSESSNLLSLPSAALSDHQNQTQDEAGTLASQTEEFAKLFAEELGLQWEELQ